MPADWEIWSGNFAGKGNYVQTCFFWEKLTRYKFTSQQKNCNVNVGDVACLLLRGHDAFLGELPNKKGPW